MNISIKQKQTHRHRQQTRGCQGGGGAGAGLGTWVSGCKLLHIDWMKNKTLLYDTGNYIQYSGINHNGRDYNINNIKKRKYICA